MVRRDVQCGGDAGAKCFGGFELEAGELEDVPLAGPRRRDHRGRRTADVAADLNRDSAGGEDVAGESGSRGLAVGTGDPDVVALEEPSGEFQVANDADATTARGFDEVQIGRHAGGQDDQV